MQRYNIFSSCHDTTNDDKHLEIMSQWHPQMHNLNQNFFLQKYLNRCDLHIMEALFVEKRAFQC